MYAVSRIEAKPGVWCWAVHFRERGKERYKGFYDIKCGGARKAHAAAVAWRDRQLTRRRTLSYREFHQLRRSDNRSGAPGVIFLIQTRMPAGLWQARVKLANGKQITKSFAVAKYGYDEAFERAVAARVEMIEAVEDRAYVHHPTAKRFAAMRRATGDKTR